MMDFDFEERQAAAISTALVLAALVPGLVGALLGIASGWVAILGGHPSHTVWGWLSTFHRDKHGHEIQGLNSVSILYWLSIGTAYIAYQAGELLAGCFNLFRDALR